MERTDERRAEQRLRYRWPVRFAGETGEKPLSGQMFDVSSGGMAFLFHASDNCPRPDQSIIADFGVPRFDSHDSFDTTFFNRTGRVCRVDNLTSRVNRIAVQFAEPLFFRPGEQDISESDAQQRLQAKARLVAVSKEEGGSNAEALAEAEERMRMYVEAQAKAQEKLKAGLEAETRAEAQARAKAEAEAKSQARLRAQAARQARAEVEKRARVEEEARQKARLYEEQIAKVKDEAAREIARIEAETAYKVAAAKAEVRVSLHEQAKTREEDDKSTKDRGKKSPKGSLVKKMDDFITDRNKIY